MHYFTGWPCRHGHVAKRYAKDGVCVDCKKTRARKWNERHPGWAARYARAAYLKDPEKYRAGLRKSYANNRATRRVYLRAYLSQNLDAHAARMAARRAAQIQATPPWATLKDCAVFYKMAARVSRCLGVPHHVDHIYPLHGRDGSRGLHVPLNLRVIPATLNMRKHNRAPTG